MDGVKLTFLHLTCVRGPLGIVGTDLVTLHDIVLIKTQLMVIGIDFLPGRVRVIKQSSNKSPDQPHLACLRMQDPSNL